MSKLLELANRCEKIEGGSLDLDLAISKAVFPDLKVGGVPAYTASLDAALMLVPDGWYWRAGRTSAFQAWAGVNRYHPDHCDKNDEFFAKREYWEPSWTPVLALVSCALRARATLLAAPREG